MVDKFYEAMELPIIKLVNWLKKKKMDRQILAYKEKLLNGRVEKQSSSDTKE